MVACSDYRTGYQDGINSMDQQDWLVFGKAEYLRGYHTGAAEKFQQDWLAENPIDTDRLVCRAPEMKVGESIFIPANYERLSNDIFRLIE